MGLSSKKTKTQQTNKPVYEAQIKGAHGLLSNTYRDQAPKIANYSDRLLGLSSSLLDRYEEGDPAIEAARGYVTDTLSSDPTQNPYLDEIIGITNDRTRNQLQAKLGTRGQTGGSGYYDLIGRALAQNESGLRYQDYDRAMSRKERAAGLAPGVVAGDFISLAPALATGSAGANLPLDAALKYAAGTGGLLGQYQDVRGTQKTSGGLAGGLLGSALSGWASGGFALSDERAKENIRPVGKTDGGLTVAVYNYKGDDTPQMGVMAQEVEKKQPRARGPKVGGFKTVNYAEVR